MKKTDDEEWSDMEVDEQKVDRVETDGSSDEDDVEMKIGEDDEDDDDDDDHRDEGVAEGIPQVSSPANNEFMDSFYGLSSNDPKQRAQSSQVLLHYCLIGPNANTKDASYTFKRLLNGVCSGRACARQGYASTLSSFLKLTIKCNNGQFMKDIIQHDKKDGDDEVNTSSLLRYVRQRLIAATDPSSHTTGTGGRKKKKGSEERDYQFGRLFGILGMVRSGILLPQADSEEVDEEIQDVCSLLISDLAELFWLKKWMREPAAHGMSTLLNSFYNEINNSGGATSSKKKNKAPASSASSKCQKIVQHLVKNVVIPKLLLRLHGHDDMDEIEVSESKFSTLLENYTSEQIAVAIHIQSQASNSVSSENLPFPLDKAILSTNTIPMIAQALSETSVVVQPRTHFVWDSIWAYLTTAAPREETEKTKDESTTPSSSKMSNRGVQMRALRQRCPVGNDSGVDVLDSLLRSVIIEKLLRMDEGSANTTHERRSLAICYVGSACGVPFPSSLDGPLQIQLQSDELENIVLKADLVRTLFIDVICAGNSSSKRKQSGSSTTTSHMLKPLALQVLQSITDSLVSDITEAGGSRRLAVIRALSNCEIRFDARTKTSTVSDLLMLGSTSGISSDAASMKSKLKLWNEYIDYLQDQILKQASSASTSSSETTGYVELLYTATKNILRLDGTPKDDKSEDNVSSELVEFKESIIRKVQCFFMVCGFFDCRNVFIAAAPADTPKSGKKKKQKGKKGNSNVGTSGAPDHPILDAAMKLKNCGENLPYTVRSVVAARFFSLVSENVNFATHNSTEDDKQAKQGKDTRMLDVLQALSESWKIVESSGAIRWSLAAASNEKEEENAEGKVDPEKLVAEFQTRVKELRSKVESSPGDSVVEAQKRCATGTAVLALSMYIHRLSCGTSEDMMENDDPDADDEDDEEEIANSMEELNDVLDGFLGGNGESEGNPLVGLAGSCVNILSSPVGSGNLGRASSPKLIREAVKFAWLGGLSLAAALSSESSTLLDAEVINILLEAIGVVQGDSMEDDEEESDEEDGDSDDDSSGDEGVFSKATGLVDDDEEMETKQAKDKEQPADDSDSDVELDPTKLQSMLEDDSDADVDAGELEHHEGADAALAKLIKLKQDARKAGQQARQKLEASNHVRCTYLLELLMTRPDSWKHLYRSDVILKLLVPMLNHRRSIEKSLEKGSEKGSNPATGEKSALLDRLTSLLNSKLCKLRLGSTPSNVDMAAFGPVLAAQVMEAATRGGSKDHSSCCSNGLVMVLRAIPSLEDKIFAAAGYSNAVEEWSTKRSTRIATSLFDDLIAHIPRYVKYAIPIFF